MESTLSEESTSGSILIDNVSEWLMSQALDTGSVENIFQGCCDRLVAAGMPLSRGFLNFRTLHPLYAALSVVWRRGEDVVVREGRHGRIFTSDEWLSSPMHHMLKTGIPYLRRRLVGAGAQTDFPYLEEMAELGHTDYLGFVVPFTAAAQNDDNHDGILGSWATDRPSGFTDRDLRNLMRVQKRLAVACKVHIKDGIARNVLATYLGRDAGDQVLSGQIQRGDAERIYAVIWYSDMRASTRLADTMPSEDFLRLVNDYFECTAGAVLANGGEVLRFIGDAVLAIFPIRVGDDTATVAGMPALSALSEANRRLAVLNADRAELNHEPIDFGVGLHIGDVMFGNIGAGDRLEFSVIGPAANEVARLESLTKSLGRRALISGEFAEAVPGNWEDLGAREVAGRERPLRVMGVPD